MQLGCLDLLWVWNCCDFLWLFEFFVKNFQPIFTSILTKPNEFLYKKVEFLFWHYLWPKPNSRIESLRLLDHNKSVKLKTKPTAVLINGQPHYFKFNFSMPPLINLSLSQMTSRSTPKFHSHFFIQPDFTCKLTFKIRINMEINFSLLFSCKLTTIINYLLQIAVTVFINLLDPHFNKWQTYLFYMNFLNKFFWNTFDFSLVTISGVRGNSIYRLFL